MYVIAGVSGKTGKVVADTLLAAGQKVRVIVRNEEKGAPWKQRGAEVAIADLDDSRAVSAALGGALGAYFLSPPDLKARDFIAERRKTLDAIAAAVKQAGTPHVAFLSSVGAHVDKGTGPIVTVHHGEKALGAVTALSAVRAGYFLENYATVLPMAKNDGVLPTFFPADAKIPTVHTTDIGRVAAEALLAGPEGRRIIELAGPEDWSARDVANAIAKRVGRPVRVQEAPVEAVVTTFTQFGMAPEMAALYAEMITAFRKGLTWEHPDKVVRGKIGLDEGLATLGI